MFIMDKMSHSGNNMKMHFVSYTGESADVVQKFSHAGRVWRLTWSVYTEKRLSACELCAEAFSSGTT